MATTQTVIPDRARVAGRIETDGDVIVLGRIEGSVQAGGLVIVGASGVAVAEIGALRVDVQGVVIGNIIGIERIDVAAGARVVGDLRAPEVAIAPGSTLEGRVDRLTPAADSKPVVLSRPALRAHGVRPSRPARPEPTPQQETPVPAIAPVMPVVAPSEAITVPEPLLVPATPRPPQRAKLVTRRKKTGETP